MKKLATNIELSSLIRYLSSISHSLNEAIQSLCMFWQTSIHVGSKKTIELSCKLSRQTSFERYAITVPFR